MIDGDALQTILPLASNSPSTSSTPIISYTGLLTLLSTSAHTLPARPIVTAHLISTLTVPPVGTSSLIVHSSSSVVPTLVRILAQESEGVHLIARATCRSFTLVVSPSMDYLDIVRHARFSGCDVDLWHLADPPSEWAAEASVAHENVGALRLHDIRPYLSLVTTSHGDTQIFTSLPFLFGDGSLASPTSVLSDTTLAHAAPTQPIGGISPTDSDGVAPIAAWMIEKDFDLHFRHSLPTDLLAEGDTPPPSRLSQATASPPSSPPEPPTDSPPARLSIPPGLGVSELAGIVSGSILTPDPLSTKLTSSTGLVALDGRKCSRLDMEWRRPILCTEGLTSTNCITSGVGSAMPASNITNTGNQNGVMSTRRDQFVHLGLSNDDKSMELGCNESQKHGVGNASSSGSTGSIQAVESSSSSSCGSGGDIMNINKTMNNLNLINERMERSRVAPVAASSVTARTVNRAKQRGGRCTYREFCNRRQCNGGHNEMELAYFSKWGGRGRFCVGKQKLCARGMSCDGRRRRSGVCSFLHRGELPFCAACLGCHGGGVCEIERNTTITENQASTLISAGCIVPLNTR